ncbi:MAG: hypothetical protein ACPLX7_10370 [Candidatus Kapaibacteriota bacterium]
MVRRIRKRACRIWDTSTRTSGLHTAGVLVRPLDTDEQKFYFGGRVAGKRGMVSRNVWRLE